MGTSIGIQSAGMGGSLAYLAASWYESDDRMKLHSFDDAPEWLQMDKAGHFTSAWFLSRLCAQMNSWSGVRRDRAVWAGALTGWMYLTAIEVMDGFSRGWGFSWTDMAANTAGVGLFLLQHQLVRYPSYTAVGKRVGSGFRYGLAGLSLKYSFHQTSYPAFRPELLGDGSLIQQAIKDYNGQSYWVSFNMNSFMNENSKFPKWINLAVGYGAEGMISGRPGYAYVYDNGSSVEFQRYRKLFLSPDIDLTRIPVKARWLKTVLFAFSFIKIPAPALEFSHRKIRAHAIYY